MTNEDQRERLFGDRPIPGRELLSRALTYMKPEWRRFLLAAVLIVFNVGLDVVLPLLVSRVTDLLTGGAFSLLHLFALAGSYCAICLFNQGFLYLESMILQKAGQSAILRLRLEIFEHIESLSRGQLSEMPVGALVTRVATYTASLSDLFTNVLVDMLRNVLTVVGVYAVMLFISWRLALVMLLFVIAVFVTSLLFRRYVSRLFRDERGCISELNTFLSENLSGMKLIQVFDREDLKALEMCAKNERLRRARYRVVVAFGIYRPFISFLYMLAVAVTFFFGVSLSLSPGMIVAFYLYLSNFFNPIQNLADQLNRLQEAFTACERIFNLLDVAPEVRDLPGAIDLDPDRVRGEIEFRDVWFAYEGDDWILKGVSFVVPAGKTCAFVGATGAGKTTILSLLVRNYEIQRGQILIDGQDITKYTVRSLRRAVGQMLQDVFLFSGSVRSNLTMNDPDVPDEAITEAVRYVGADRFLGDLPAGLEREVLAGGENFSQGERQLLSFARTVLHRPQILILDEATANIDTETEVLIQRSLEKMRSIGTMLIVAHRLSTVRGADQIIVLSGGEITERGTHDELIAKGGRYFKLYELQRHRADAAADMAATATDAAKAPVAATAAGTVSDVPAAASDTPAETAGASAGD